MKSTCEFISGAANTVSDGAHWFRHENHHFVAYSCHNLILIANVEDTKVICSLKGHEKRITSIALIYDEFQVTIFSASDDCTVRVWRHTWADTFTMWKHSVVHTMKAPINALSVSKTPSNDILLAISDIQGYQCVLFQSFSVDQSDKSIFHLVDSHKMPPSQIACSLQLQVLQIQSDTSKSSVVFLFCGSVDSKVYVRTSSISLICSIITTGSDKQSHCQQAFSTVGTLTGHEEWITCLHAYTLTPSSTLSTSLDQPSFYLASGSKDSKIRIWRVDSRCHQLPDHSESHTVSTVTPIGDSAGNILDENADDGVEEEEEDDEGVEGGATKQPQVDEDEGRSEARLHFKTSIDPSNPKNILSVSVFLEALLVGHEDWVTSVQFMNPIQLSEPSPVSRPGTSSSSVSDLSLFSTSMDRNMVIWRPDVVTGIWMPIVRVGDIGGQLGGCVGGNLLGFVGGSVSPDSKSLIGIGYGGSLHLWKRAIESATKSSLGFHSSDQNKVYNSNFSDRWSNAPFLTGHFASVNDLAWDEHGQYFVTVSSDQTCRLFATVGTQPNSSAGHSSQKARQWKEVCRPQVHGYDLNCVILLHKTTEINHETSRDMSVSDGGSGGIGDQSSSSLPSCLVTAGDEKLIRVHSPSQGVIEGVRKLCPTIPSTHISVTVYQAAIPELSLSNKAVSLLNKQELEELALRNVYKLNWSIPPVDSQLSDYTVWPEDHKFFGHANDVICLAVNGSGTLLASACKSKDKNTAKIMIWDLQSYVCLYTLDEHDSTIVTMQFSPDDQFLVTSGKDRLLCLFAYDLPSGRYVLVSGMKNAHKRIVWDCTWSHDSALVYTVSRDGSMKVWSVAKSSSDSNGTEGATMYTMKCVYSLNPFDGDPVTSIDSLSSGPGSVDSYLAMGSESGAISIWRMASDGLSADRVHTVSDLYSHGAAVKRVRWYKKSNKHGALNSIEQTPDSQSTKFYLASCGEDNTVRLFSFSM